MHVYAEYKRECTPRERNMRANFDTGRKGAINN